VCRQIGYTVTLLNQADSEEFTMFTMFEKALIQPATSIKVQKQVNQLVGPLLERRLPENRRSMGNLGGRRKTDSPDPRNVMAA
jgi:hypothetical protein